MVTILCTVVKSKVMTTRSNQLMAFTTIEDLTGTIEMLVFPKIYAECRAWLQENAVIVVQGRVSYKEDEGTRLLVEGVRPIDGYDPDRTFGENRAAAAGEQRRASARVTALWLLVPSMQSEQMHRIENLLQNIFDGTTPVYFKFEDSGQRMRAPQSMWANDHPLLRAELERILGKDHVKQQTAK